VEAAIFAGSKEPAPRPKGRGFHLPGLKSICETGSRHLTETGSILWPATYFAAILTATGCHNASIWTSHPSQSLKSGLKRKQLRCDSLQPQGREILRRIFFAALTQD